LGIDVLEVRSLKARMRSLRGTQVAARFHTLCENVTAGEALANQGAAITGTTTPAPTLSRQRAFTARQLLIDSKTKGGNVSDLLLVETLYQRSDALEGLSVAGNSENRWVFRFVATPYLNYVHPEALKNTKLLLGIEVNDDFAGGKKDIRMFYGVNVDLKALF
jgi:hypothetical protein